jgi:hypothetical protein
MRAAAASLALALALALSASLAAAETQRVVLNFGTSSAPTGIYRFRSQALNTNGPAGWTTNAFDDSAWAQGAQPFGNNIFCQELTSRYGANAATNFPINSELFLRFRYDIPVDADLSTYHENISVVVDNGLRSVHINGHDIGFAINREQCSGVSTTFMVDLPNDKFVHGQNVIAIHAEDHGSQSYFNMRITDRFIEDELIVDCPVGFYPTQQGGNAEITSPVSERARAGGQRGPCALTRRRRRRRRRRRAGHVRHARVPAVRGVLSVSAPRASLPSAPRPPLFCQRAAAAAAPSAARLGAAHTAPAGNEAERMRDWEGPMRAQHRNGQRGRDGAEGGAGRRRARARGRGERQRRRQEREGPVGPRALALGRTGRPQCGKV